MKELYYSLAVFSFVAMLKRNGCPNLFSDKGKKLHDYIKQMYFEMGKNHFSAEVLDEASGSDLANICKNLFSGRTEISLVHLLYLIFALKMERYHAFAFLSFFGFSKHSLDDCPYSEFYDLIGDYSEMGDQEAKKYVDDIINKAIDNHKSQKK